MDIIEDFVAMGKRLIILFILCAVSALAADFVDIYRKKGAGAAVAEMEKALSEKSYWMSYLANVDTTFGFYEGDKDILICDKSKPELTLYKLKNGRIGTDSRVPARVGTAKGEKMREGDMKTPTGSYDLLNRIKPPSDFYGPLAFTTDYPNLYDVTNGKNGHGIWIHGLPKDGNRNENTKGCVVVGNDYLVQLEKKINFKKAVLIVDDKALRKTSKEDIAVVISSMFLWKKAWVSNNLREYLSFYDENFKRFDGMRKPQFVEYKKRIFGKNERKEIVFREFEVTPNPTTYADKVFKVKFYEEYSAPSYKFKGYKDLFVQVKNGKMTILAER